MSSIKFSNHVNSVSRSLGKCKIVFEPAEEDKKNEAQVVFDMKKRSHYIWQQDYGYFQREKEFNLGY